LRIFVQLIIALQYIHAKKMLHRDMTSANVFLMQSGLVKLGDFGFSKSFEDTVSKSVSNTFLGTPYYLAPEIWNKKPYGKRAELYSSGVILYEMLTTKRPYFGANLQELKDNVLAGVWTMPKGISKETEELLRSLLSANPSERLVAEQILLLPMIQPILGKLSAYVSGSKVISQDNKALFATNMEQLRHSLEQYSAVSQVFDSIVLKVSREGTKEKRLMLTTKQLNICSMSGPEMIRTVQLTDISSVDVCTSVADPVNPECYFQVESDGAIAVFKTAAKELRDTWIEKLRFQMNC